MACRASFPLCDMRTGSRCSRRTRVCDGMNKTARCTWGAPVRVVLYQGDDSDRSRCALSPTPVGNTAGTARESRAVATRPGACGACRPGPGPRLAAAGLPVSRFCDPTGHAVGLGHTLQPSWHVGGTSRVEGHRGSGATGLGSDGSVTLRRNKPEEPLVMEVVPRSDGVHPAAAYSLRAFPSKCDKWVWPLELVKFSFFR